MPKKIEIAHIQCPLTPPDVQPVSTSPWPLSPAGAAPAAETAKPSKDRIFDAIGKHVSSNRAFIDFCNAHEDPSNEPGHADLLQQDWDDWCAVCETEPETLIGAAALARYVSNWTNHRNSLLYNDEQSATLESLATALERLTGVKD